MENSLRSTLSQFTFKLRLVENYHLLRKVMIRCLFFSLSKLVKLFKQSFVT